METEFQIGDVVECISIKNSIPLPLKLAHVYTVSALNSVGIKLQELPDKEWFSSDRFILANNRKLKQGDLVKCVYKFGVRHFKCPSEGEIIEVAFAHHSGQILLIGYQDFWDTKYFKKYVAPPNLKIFKANNQERYEID